MDYRLLVSIDVVEFLERLSPRHRGPLRQAIGAIRSGNVEVKNRSLSRAVRILDEGLKAALNLESGELALDLRDLYAYICTRLTYANLRSDDVAVEECVKLLQPIKEAWASIAPAAADQRAAA